MLEQLFKHSLLNWKHFVIALPTFAFNFTIATFAFAWQQLKLHLISHLELLHHILLRHCLGNIGF